MTHYKMTQDLPAAIITVNGNEKKIYNENQIFLNNGDNFEIRFFNPLQEKIGVEILFNGQKKNDNFLILRPGENITIDRFLDEKKKMIYDTYIIDENNLSSVKASELNGLIEFRFYKEKLYSFNRFYYGYINYPFFPTCTDINIFYNDIFYNGNTTSSPSYNLNTSTLNLNSNLVTNTSSSVLFKQSFKEIETGRIEKGSDSNQEMKIVNVDFETNSFHTITYYMKPNSTKDSEISEIRNYCNQCSYRIRKKSWKYCPKCGNNLF